jgi:hypothetical protein
MYHRRGDAIDAPIGYVLSTQRVRRLFGKGRSFRLREG